MYPRVLTAQRGYFGKYCATMLAPGPGSNQAPLTLHCLSLCISDCELRIVAAARLTIYHVQLDVLRQLELEARIRDRLQTQRKQNLNNKQQPLIINRNEILIASKSLPPIAKPKWRDNCNNVAKPIPPPWTITTPPHSPPIPQPSPCRKNNNAFNCMTHRILLLLELASLLLIIHPSIKRVPNRARQS